jgi:pimeloyl-ACP methyl ester carboxylesterase
MDFYSGLIDVLTSESGRLHYEEGTDLKLFAYDWRQHIGRSAAQLAKFMEAQLESGTRQFRLVAHSMGGLVARLALADNQKLSEKTALLVQLGSPMRGAADTFPTLRRNVKIKELTWVIAALQRWHPVALHDLLTTLGDFDSLYQLLPHDDEPCLLSRTGKKYTALANDAWPPHRQDKLEDARKLQARLRSVEESEACHVWYGVDIPTDSMYRVDENFDPDRPPFQCDGDGRVSCESAFMTVLPANRNPVHGGDGGHSALPNSTAVHEKLVPLLMK